MPLVFLIAALFLLGNYLVRETVSFAVDIGIILSGVPIYLQIVNQVKYLVASGRLAPTLAQRALASESPPTSTPRLLRRL